MRKIGFKTLALTAALFLLGGCGSEGGGSAPVFGEDHSDIAYVREKGTLVVGITDFAPMDYREGETWDGFDAELAKEFAEEIGVSAVFQEINWEEKTGLLEDGTIDCIWNGMTMTEELQREIDCSKPYLSNAQVIVLPKDKADQYGTAEQCQHLLFATEAGSSGEELLKGLRYRYTAYGTQMEAMQSVSEGRTDAAVMDIVMAGYYTAEGRESAELTYRLPLNDEKICVGMRKGSDLTEQVNAFLERKSADGSLKETAEKYGIGGAVLDIAAAERAD